MQSHGKVSSLPDMCANASNNSKGSGFDSPLLHSFFGFLDPVPPSSMPRRSIYFASSGVTVCTDTHPRSIIEVGDDALRGETGAWAPLL
jgi:hypothetical protein